MSSEMIAVIMRPPAPSSGPPIQAEGAAPGGRLGARLDLEDPCTAFSVCCSCCFLLPDKQQLWMILSFHFDANLFLFLSVEAAQTE